MKTIYAVLLLLAGAQAQAIDTLVPVYDTLAIYHIRPRYGVVFKGVGGEKIEKVSLVRTASSPDTPTPLTIESLVALWDTYKAECWADSTADTVGYKLLGVPDRKNPKLNIGFVKSEPKLRWHHRPATLDGFMEFLRSRTVNMEHPRRAKEIRDEIWRRANRKEKESDK